MKHIRVLHNPGAGTTQHSEKKIISLIEAMGFTCSYYSTKKDGQKDFISEDADIMAIAGGDGTVRKLVDEILHRKMLDKKPPIGLLPCGTANNIARMLDIAGTPEEIISRWRDQNIKQVDVAKVYGLKEQEFIMESLGFGVFPKLIKKMKTRSEKPGSPAQELKVAVKELYKIVSEYKGRECTVTIDGQRYSGQYLLVEVMNTQSVGPNLNLAPKASVSDGLLDVVLVPISQRDKLAGYVNARLKYGKDELFFGTAIQGAEINVEWSGKLVHADDQLVVLKKPITIKLSARKGLIEFLV